MKAVQVKLLKEEETKSAADKSNKNKNLTSKRIHAPQQMDAGKES